MLERFDPRYFLARCVRCNLRGSPLCPRCASVPAARTYTPSGHCVRAIGPYAGPVGERVRRLKYGDETHLAYPLGRALHQLLHESVPCLRDAILVPIPLHPTRLSSRGYNQSALVSRALSRRKGPHVALDLLERTSQGPSQARLSGEARRANLLDGFVARAPMKAATETVRRIFLVDDVVTTGSTIDACAAALQHSGLTIEGVFACAIADRNLVDLPNG